MSQDLSPDEHDDLEAEDGEEKAPFRRYLTRLGAERMHRELIRLLNEERPKVTAEVSAAAAQGDRSENAEYIYGKKRLREIDRRIRFLTKRLDSAFVVDPSVHYGNDQVFFGATVSYLNKAGEEHTVTIVGIDELDPLKGKISWISPVARALTKAREGDVVTLQTPLGTDELEILSVDYPEPITD